jgi:ketosteroid isomerase-like protein
VHSKLPAVSTVAESFHALLRAATEDRDARAFASLWVVDDPTITMWGSDLAELAEGPEAVRQLGAAITALDEEIRFHWDAVQIHERGEVAWVNARGTITVGSAERPYRMTAVLLQTYAGWRWHTFDGSVPDSGT